MQRNTVSMFAATTCASFCVPAALRKNALFRGSTPYDCGVRRAFDAVKHDEITHARVAAGPGLMAQFPAHLGGYSPSPVTTRKAHATAEQRAGRQPG
jgi:hypothetical protein